MVKRFLGVFALLLTFALVVSGCGGTATPAEEEAAAPTQAPAEEKEEAKEEPKEEEPVAEKEEAKEEEATEGHRYGQITDVGGIDDKGFNQLAWVGMQKAGQELGVEVQFLESQQQTDYEKNIAEFVNQGYNGIITVGFLLADATKAASEANPDVPFAIVDFPSQTSGDMGLLFAVDQPSFMAGYLAAGMSQTGTVCTYGGIKIPPVVAFMVGFESGVNYYNEQKGTEVKLLGWKTDPAAEGGGDGSFTGNFESLDDGRSFAENFFDEGCDIVFPVAGPVGLGSAAAAQDRGFMVIGVDADLTQTNPDAKEVYLTSVLKKIDVAVFEAVKQMEDGSFQGGTNFVSTLANGGVGLAPFYDYDADVSQELKDELAAIEQGLIDGSISTGWPVGEAPAEEAEAEEPSEGHRYGQITDVGGIDDKGFNQLAWVGMQKAGQELGVEVQFLESQQQTDYEKNIAEFVNQGYNGIITVGFLLADATKAASEANPDVPFAIVDFPSQTSGDMGLLFAVDQPSFMAGYLAAGMSQTGTVCTYGGIKIPPVVAFMVGFESGVNYYNEQKGTEVKLLGWETDAAAEGGGNGSFTGNFESLDDGRSFAENFFDEGCDIVFPVAGPVGLGSAAAAQDRGFMVIGVDADLTQTNPDAKEVYLTSVLKKIDVAVFEAVKQMEDGSFQGGTNLVSTLENGGVGLAPFYDYDADVSQELKDELAAIEQGLIDGSISTGWPVGEAPAEEEKEAMAAPAAGELGSAEKPIQVLFVPSVDAGVIVSGGEVLAQALNEATGLTFKVDVPTSYAATVEAMCASPDDTIGFIPALGYVLANNRCNVEVGAAAVRRGLSWYAAQFLVARDSDIQSIEDLNGKKWAVPDLGSTSGYLYPSVMLKEAGVEPGEIVEAGGHPQSVLAVYNGDVDFSTSFFSPPLTDPAWKFGDNPEPFEPAEVARDADGNCLAGEVQVLDARCAAAETAPDVFEKVRILSLSQQIPNDTMSFSPEFPEELRQVIVEAMVEFAGSEACAESICSEDFYGWTGIEPVDDSFYDPVRSLIEVLGYTEEDVFK